MINAYYYLNHSSYQFIMNKAIETFFGKIDILINNADTKLFKKC